MTKNKKRIISLSVGALMLFSATPVLTRTSRTALAEEASAVEKVNYEGASYETVKAAGVEALRETPTETITSWSKYDSRDFGLVTPVQSQGTYTICWSFASIATMEVSILREGLTNKTADYTNLWTDFDPNKHFKLDEYEFTKAASCASGTSKFIDPLGLATNGVEEGDTGSGKDGNSDMRHALRGSEIQTAGTLGNVFEIITAWQGVYELDPTYTSVDAIKEGVGSSNAENLGNRPATAGYSQYKLQNAIIVDNDVNEIKSLVAQYGAVFFEYYINPTLMKDENQYWVSNMQSANHASTIVGWVDDISAEAPWLGGTPSRGGAWIVKNSWGTGFHGAKDENNVGEGYYYLSYDSQFIRNPTAFDLTTDETESMGEEIVGNKDDFKFKWNYNFIDGGGDGTTNARADWPKDSGAWAAQLFQAQNKGVEEYNAANPGKQGKEYLAGVMVGVRGKNIDIEVKVHTSILAHGGDWKSYYQKALYQEIVDDTLFNPVGGTEATYTGHYTAETSGIYTIPLNGLVELTKNTWFSVEVIVTNGLIMFDASSNLNDADDSYVFVAEKYGNYWRNCGSLFNSSTVSVKALTAIGVEDDFTDTLEGGSIEVERGPFVYNFGEEAIEPKITVRTAEGKVVQQGLYNTVYSETVNSTEGKSDATITVTGGGLYTGTLTATYKIEQLDISNLTGVTAEFAYIDYDDIDNGDGTVTYKGYEYEPRVFLYRNGKPIDDGDFYYDYEDNIQVGMAKIIVYGRNNLKGILESSELTFEITKAEQPAFTKGTIRASEIPSYANKLAHVPLPEGWEWVEPETKLVRGSREYQAIYSDSHNYETHPVDVTVIVTQIGDGVVPGEDPSDPTATPVDAFVAEVAKIANASTLEAKFTAIKSACEKWNALSETERASEEATAAYATLQSAITAYKESANALNEAHVSAMNSGIAALSVATIATVSILAAAVYVGKRFFF